MDSETTVYKKYTLKEVKPIIEDLVRKSISYQELADKEEKFWREKHPSFGLYNSNISEQDEKEFKTLTKKSLNNPYKEELRNLTHYHTPIKNSKKCCRNCAVAICHLRDDNWHYCKDYRPAIREEIFYIKPIFGRPNGASLTIEQQVNNQTKAYLEDYKKVLKRCKDLEDSVPKNIVTKPFSQAALDKEAEFQKEQKQYWDEFEDTFDKEEQKIKGDGPFAGMTLYSAKPNKERQKAFFEKWNKCPLGAMAESMGLIKEKEDGKA